MYKSSVHIKVLRGFIISLCLLFSTLSAEAQTGRIVAISAPETNQFPLITVYYDVLERDGRLVSGLEEDQVTITEDGINQAILDYQSLNPGVQLVTAINISAPFGIQDISGLSRFDYISDTLIDWANQPSLDPPDDLSLISNDGLDLTHVDSRDQFIPILEEYSPNLRETEPNFNVLSRAIEIASDPVDQRGMKRVVLLFSPPATEEGITAIESLISQAKDNQVIVYTILVSSPAYFESPGAEILRNLSLETQGEFYTYSGEEPLPDWETLFAPLRSTYLITYQSKIVTSGIHTVEVTIGSDLGESRGQKDFTLEVLPPNPIFISPPQEIIRSAPQNEESISLIEYRPSSVALDVIVEFPDRHPRDLEELIFRVDGEVESRLTTPPFDQVKWDLSQYQTSSVHYLTLEVVDTLGLSRQSLQTPVQIDIDIPPPTIGNIVMENAGALIGLFLVLIIGLVLFILVSKGTIKPDISFGGKRTPGHREVINNKKAKTNKSHTIGKINDSTDTEILVHPIKYRLIPVSDVAIQQITEPIQVREEHIFLGNDPAGDIININHASVANRHAQITVSPNGEYKITDEGSPSGTWINYKPIDSTTPQLLKDGDIIHIGEAGFRFQVINNSETMPTSEELSK